MEDLPDGKYGGAVVFLFRIGASVLKLLVAPPYEF
jgi:hypothetical protein